MQVHMGVGDELWFSIHKVSNLKDMVFDALNFVGFYIEEILRMGVGGARNTT